MDTLKLTNKFIDKYFLKASLKGSINQSFQNFNIVTKTKLKRLVIKNAKLYEHLFGIDIKYRFIKNVTFSNSHKKRITIISVDFYNSINGRSIMIPSYLYRVVKSNYEIGDFKGQFPYSETVKSFKDMNEELNGLKLRISILKSFIEKNIHNF